MNVLVTDKLLNLLMTSMTFSVILMAIIQKFKTLKWINKDWHIWVINLILSFSLGHFFSVYFYNLSFNDALWVSIFGFVGASSIYQILKKQNIINYTPTSLNSSGEYIEVPKENEIRR
jgi:hypothetical protein